MKILSVLQIATVLALAGCAGTEPTADVPRDFEDVPRNYIVFFSEDSATLDEAARGVIAQAAQDSVQFQPMRVEVSGYSGDGPGSPVTSELAERRFSAVANALVAEGLNPSLIGRSELTSDPNLPDFAVDRIEIHFELP